MIFDVAPMKKQRDKDKYWFLDMVAASGGEAAEMAKDLKRQYIEGVIKEVPRTYLGCRDWETAWLYFFHRGVLFPDDYMKRSGNKIIEVSLVGADFDDKIVDALEKIASRIGVNCDLKELRLFRTKFTQKALDKLQVIFPNAKITLFDEKQEKENPKLKWINRNDV
jgi:hypothetical protein